MYSSDELFQHSREGYFGVYFPSCEATREINIKITLVWVQKQLDTRIHTLFYFLHDINNPYMMIKTTIFTHRPHVSLTLFSFCWWCHNPLLMTSQWPDNCDAITWIVISNSLDIDFIHRDIHSRSCKKVYSSSWSIFLASAIVEIMACHLHGEYNYSMYRKTSYIRRTLAGNKIVDHSDVVGCRRCSNYIFILDLTSGFKGFCKDSCKTLRDF